MTATTKVVICSSEWQYVGKGARHVVFRYVGGDAAWRGRMLRFRRATDLDCAAEERSYAEAVAWLSRVMLRIVDPRFVDVAELVRVASADVVSGFARGCGVPLANAVCVLPDYTRCDVMVEIKPKKGTIFASPAWCDQGMPIAPGDPIKHYACRHCMQQALKYKTGKIAAPSGYCPLQLFAAARGESQQALEALFANPQNNLLVRVAGEVVDPARLPSTQQRELIKRIGRVLETTGVLATLLDAQRVIPLDIDALQEAADRGSSTVTYVPTEHAECHGERGHCAAVAARALRSPLHPAVAPTDHTAVTVPLPAAVDAYHLARSAWDASVILQLFNDTTRAAQARIIDLDQKPRRKFEAWVLQEHAITAAFREAIGGASSDSDTTSPDTTS